MPNRPRAALRLTLALVFAFGAASARSAEPGAGQPAQGVALESAPAVFETTAQIMARHDRMLLEAPQRTLDFFIGRQDSRERKLDPDAEGRLQGPARGPQSPSIAGSGDLDLPQTVGVNADGPGSGASPCGTPPDTMGAVGPTQFIAFVNCNVVSYDKSTGLPDGVLNRRPRIRVRTAPARRCRSRRRRWRARRTRGRDQTVSPRRRRTRRFPPPRRPRRGRTASR